MPKLSYTGKAVLDGSVRSNPIFDEVTIKDPEMSVFDLSHQVLTSGNLGKLYPTLNLEVFPHDVVRLKSNYFSRCTQLATPFLGTYKFKVHTFYCANRLVWTRWCDFISNKDKYGKNFTDANRPEIPWIDYTYLRIWRDILTYRFTYRSTYINTRGGSLSQSGSIWSSTYYNYDNIDSVYSFCYPFDRKMFGPSSLLYRLGYRGHIKPSHSVRNVFKPFRPEEILTPASWTPAKIYGTGNHGATYFEANETVEHFEIQNTGDRYNTLALRAYHLIWEEYYKNQLLCAPDDIKGTALSNYADSWFSISGCEYATGGSVGTGVDNIALGSSEFGLSGQDAPFIVASQTGGVLSSGQRKYPVVPPFPISKKSILTRGATGDLRFNSTVAVNNDIYPIWVPSTGGSDYLRLWTKQSAPPVSMTDWTNDGIANLIGRFYYCFRVKPIGVQCDYFTTCQLSPLGGDKSSAKEAVAFGSLLGRVDISGTCTSETAVEGTDIPINLSSYTFGKYAPMNGQVSLGSGGTRATQLDEPVLANNLSGVYALNQSLVGSITNGVSATSVSWLRYAYALQSILEKDNVAGTKYFDYMLSHFGTRPSNAYCERPVYLGGTGFELKIDMVQQTSETTEEHRLGELGANGTAQGSTDLIRFEAPEHGHILQLVSIVPDYIIDSGVEKQHLRSCRFDYFMPEFAQLGYAPVWTKEYNGMSTYTGTVPFSQLVGTPDGMSCLYKGEESRIFGYQPIYSSEKFMMNHTDGEMQTTWKDWIIRRTPTYRGTEPWNYMTDKVSCHLLYCMAEEYTHIDPSTQLDPDKYCGKKPWCFGRLREDNYAPFADKSEDVEHFLIGIYHDISVVRALPKIGIPNIY